MRSLRLLQYDPRSVQTVSAAAVIARVMEVPVLGSYHTELAAYAGLRAADPKLELIAYAAMAAFYGQCQVVLSPSPASDEVLRGMGIDAARASVSASRVRSTESVAASPSCLMTVPSAASSPGATSRESRKISRLSGRIVRTRSASGPSWINLP